jgi:hypothetical protein
VTEIEFLVCLEENSSRGYRSTPVGKNSWILDIGKETMVFLDAWTAPEDKATAQVTARPV